MTWRSIGGILEETNQRKGNDMKQIEERLFALQDLEYRDFHARLMPGYEKEHIIGVRTPALRKLAKELAKEMKTDETIAAFLTELPHKYYEENNLHAFLIEQLAKDFEQALTMTEAFLPYIDNWATCDCFTPKAFKKDLNRLYDKTLEWMKSAHTYTVRYGIVTQLQLFLDDAFRPEMLEILAQIHRDDYYINMAIAWYYSFALIKQYDSTIGLFQAQTLDKWIHNKSLQKAIESYRIDKETKDYLRSLKRK